MSRLDPNELAEGRFNLLNQSVLLAPSWNWRTPSDDQLWRYTLHYFEWAWSLVDSEQSEAFEFLFDSWRDSTVIGSWDEWSPYVVALRSWAFCGIYAPLVKGQAIEQEFLTILRRQQKFLRRNTERDVRGNHLIKNLKALVGLAVFFEDDRGAAAALDELHSEIRVQVLADGGHYELSPAYHCQVLGDFIDVAELLRVVGKESSEIDKTIIRMREWLGAMLHPDGQTAAFNDCWPIEARDVARLKPTEPAHGLTALPDSGYLTYRDQDRYIVLDVGVPCPEALPAHAHADCLSIECSINGRRLVVNGAVSTYSGEQRQHERSTAAHSTVEINGLSQTDVYGSFRAGRRAQPFAVRFQEDGECTTMAASHDGYVHLPGSPTVRREVSVLPGEIRIVDEVHSAERVTAVSRFFLAPDRNPQVDGCTIRVGDAKVELCGPFDLTFGPIATGFGCKRTTAVISQNLQTDVESNVVRIRTPQP